MGVSTVLSCLKDNPATKAIPVIVITARELSDAEVAGLRSNLTAVLQRNRQSHESAPHTSKLSFNLPFNQLKND